MWSLILRKDDEAYDIIPNSWLKTTGICLYPNSNFKETNMLARNCAKPEDNWEEIEVTLVKKDYDNFDRGYTDMIRKTSGKRTLSASEKEEKGKGRRTKTQKKMLYEGYSQSSGIKRFPSPESRDDSCSSDGSLGYKPKKQNVIPPFPTLELPVTPKPSSYRPELTPKSSSNRLFESSPTVGQNVVSRIEKCPCPGKTHTCSFDETGNVTLASIGKTLCTISRTLTLYGGKFNYLKEESEELKHMVLALKDSARPKSDLPSYEESTHVEQILGFFPVSSMENLKVVDTKLGKDNDFFSACVAYFASASEKGNENRTVTSILCRMITLHVAQNFTFKGVQRKDHKERKESFKDLHLSKVLLAALQRCWPKADIKKACSTAASWLAQARSKIQRMNIGEFHADEDLNNDEDIHEK